MREKQKVHFVFLPLFGRTLPPSQAPTVLPRLDRVATKLERKNKAAELCEAAERGSRRSPYQ
jgi:hypothetical protein